MKVLIATWWRSSPVHHQLPVIKCSRELYIRLSRGAFSLPTRCRCSPILLHETIHTYFPTRPYPSQAGWCVWFRKINLIIALSMATVSFLLYWLWSDHPLLWVSTANRLAYLRLQHTLPSRQLTLLLIMSRSTSLSFSPLKSHWKTHRKIVEHFKYKVNDKDHLCNH